MYSEPSHARERKSQHAGRIWMRELSRATYVTTETVKAATSPSPTQMSKEQVMVSE